MAWRASLSRCLQEVRIHLCRTSPASAGAREFVLRNYKDLKMLNPRLPILIRECSGIRPRLYARYGLGVEKSVSLEDLGEEDISKRLKELVQAAPPAPS
eukprot:SM000001S04552  [mRNA]  locus=s1:959588:960183:+ [translate_table: standard]